MSRHLASKLLPLALGAAVFTSVLSGAPASAEAVPEPELVAGGNSAGFAGDGGQAASALFDNVRGLVRTPEGDLLVADQGNNRIRKIDQAQVASTFAGTGYSDGGTCDGPLLSATISQPTGMVRAPDGRIFVAASGAHVVCVITPTGQVHTYAGNYRIEPDLDREGKTASLVSLLYPEGLAFDARDGSLYISESGSCRVVRVAKDMTFSTFAEQTPCIRQSEDFVVGGLNHPVGLHIDGGRLLVADGMSNSVLAYDLSTGNPSHVAGTGAQEESGDGGAATQAGVNYPTAVTTDAAGNVYIGSGSAGSVRMVDASGTISTYGRGLRFLNGLISDGAGGFYASDSHGVMRFRGSQPGVYLALGDSYSSGLGARSADGYMIGTDGPENRCRRSTLAYGYRYWQEKLANTTDLGFYPCAGAVVADFFSPYAENHHGENVGELAQLDRVRNTPNVKEITLTIGGNDAMFPQVMEYCAQRMQRQATCKKKFGHVVDVALYAMRPGQSNELARLYRELKKEAPQARIRVLGYPRFFPWQIKGRCFTGVGALTFLPSDTGWINSRIKEMNEIIQLNAEAAGVEYVDVFDAFDGHELCTKEPWMNNADNIFHPEYRTESFHPKSAGQDAIGGRL